MGPQFLQYLLFLQMMETCGICGEEKFPQLPDCFFSTNHRLAKKFKIS